MKGWHAKGYAQMMNELVPDEDITQDEDSRAFKGAGMIPISQIERGVYDVALVAGRVQGEQDVMSAWATASEIAAYFENTSEDEIMDAVSRDSTLKLEGDKISFADNPLSFTDEKGKTKPKTTMDSWGKFSAEVDSGGIQTGNCYNCKFIGTNEAVSHSDVVCTNPESEYFWNLPAALRCSLYQIGDEPGSSVEAASKGPMTGMPAKIDVPREELESKLAQWGKAPDLPAPNVDWGRPYGGQEASFLMSDGSPVWMFRNGQRVRFYDENGQQVGEEQANVAPAIAYALSQGWQDVSGPQMKVPGYEGETKEAYKLQEHGDSTYDVLDDQGNVVMSQESYQVASNFVEGSPRGEYSETDEVRDVVESKQADQEADPIEKARMLGQQAFLRGDKPVPAWDAELMAMLEGRNFESGNNTVALLQAWSDGWTKANLDADVPGWTEEENQALRDARGTD